VTLCSAGSAKAKHLRSAGPHGDAQLRNCMQGGKQSETKEVIR